MVEIITENLSELSEWELEKLEEHGEIIPSLRSLTNREKFEISIFHNPSIVLNNKIYLKEEELKYFLALINAFDYTEDINTVLTEVCDYIQNENKKYYEMMNVIQCIEKFIQEDKPNWLEDSRLDPTNPILEQDYTMPFEFEGIQYNNFNNAYYAIDFEREEDKRKVADKPYLYFQKESRWFPKKETPSISSNIANERYFMLRYKQLHQNPSMLFEALGIAGSRMGLTEKERLNFLYKIMENNPNPICNQIEEEIEGNIDYSKAFWREEDIDHCI